VSAAQRAAIDASAPMVATAGEWRAKSPRKSYRAAAQAFARKHGKAVVMRADDSALVFTLNTATGRIVQRSHKASAVDWLR
jgi:hypothetical protein